MLMELIIIVFIKLMGAIISGHWACKIVVHSLGWQSGLGPGWQCEGMAHTLPSTVPVVH